MYPVPSRFHHFGQVVMKYNAYGWNQMKSRLLHTCHHTHHSVGSRHLKAYQTSPYCKQTLIRLFGTHPDSELKDVSNLLSEGGAQKIIVMAGAGLSTQSGIPDFRSPETGLYDNLQKYNLPYAEAIFDIDYFKYDPSAFFCLAKELYPSGKYKPNAAHLLIRLLNDKKKLLQMYTQNIDGLERLAGLGDDRLIECHGSFNTATCQVCHKSYEGVEIKDSIMREEIPICTKASCNGVVKPDVVFFGEGMPAKFFQSQEDFPEADLLLILGTSLEVYPFAGLSERSAMDVPRVMFNMVPTGPFLYKKRKNDIFVQGDIVENIWKLVDKLGWKNELTSLMLNIDNKSYWQRHRSRTGFQREAWIRR